MKKSIFITGVSSGLGKAIAESYLKNDYTVIAMGRNKPQDSIFNSESFQFIEHDLSKLSEIPSKMSHFEKIEKLSVVILNAGILPEIQTMQRTSLENIKRTMDINLWSNKILLDGIIEKVKSIKQVCAVSSGASVNGAKGWNAYSISKAGLNMLIQLYAKEQKNTHFSAIAPGVVLTAMQDYIYSLENADEFPVVGKLQEMRNHGKMSTPHEAAKRFVNAIEMVKNFPSGSFIDVRKVRL